MSKSHQNPYNVKSNYGKLFAFMQGKQVYTRADLIAQAIKLGMSDEIEKGKHVSPAGATVTVMLSPRDEKQEGLRGDPRGNLSSRGEVYFNEILNRESGEKQKFRLRWRTKALERRSRTAKEVKQEKASKKSVKKTVKKTAKKAKTVATSEVTE